MPDPWFREIADNTPALLWASSENADNTFVNVQLARFLGIGESAIGSRWVDFVHPEDGPTVVEAFLRASRAESDYEGEFRLRRHDGVYRHVVSRGTPRRSASGGFMGYYGSIFDITEWKLAEDELRSQSAMVEAVFSQSIACLCLLDPDLRLIRVNEAFARHYRKTVDDFPGRRSIELFPNDAWAVGRFASVVDHVVRTRSPIRVTASPYVFTDQPERGTTYWDYFLQPILDQAGVVESVLYSSVEVTDRAHAEEALRSSEDRYRTLIEQTADGVFLLDREGRILDANPAAAALLGCSGDELRGRRWSELVEPADLDDPDLAVPALETGRRVLFERTLRRSDGDVVDVEISGRRLSSGFFLGAARDIGARRAAARERARLVTAIEQSADSILITDVEGTIEYANPAFERTSGFTRAEAIGTNARLLQSGLHRPDFYRAMWDQLRSGRSWTGEFINRRRDGALYHDFTRISPVRDAKGIVTGYVAVQRDVTEARSAEAERARLAAAVEQNLDGILITDGSGMVSYANPAFERQTGIRREGLLRHHVFEALASLGGGTSPAEAIRAVRDGRSWTGDLELPRPDGSRRLAQLTVAPIHNGADEPTSYLVVWRDVTRERELERQLRLAQRMEAVGQLAGGIAHDFNNLLTVASGYAQILQREIGEADPRHLDLEQILVATQRGAGLVRQLLAFSRRQVLQPEILDLDGVVSDIAPMLRRLLGEQVELVTVRMPGLWWVKADAGQLEQVLVNLALNSRDAMPEGGTLTIETSNVEVDTAETETAEAIPPGSYVLLAVSDTGIGIDPATLEHIFEPFFTTKDPDKGSGLGLATAYGIVSQSGGHVLASSQVGSGTTFRIYLPRAQGEPIAHSEPSAADRIASGSETVLVVEDDPDVRAFTVRVLGEYGYRVLAATRASEAEAVVDREGGAIDLLVTDVILPDVRGGELAARLTALAPAMQVLFVSGYPEDAVVQSGALNETIAFLAKPFTVEAVARRVRTVLDARR